MDKIPDIISRYAGHPQMLIVALHEIQDYVGYIPATVVKMLSGSLGISEGEVQAVISFYTELRTMPTGEYHLRVCQGDSCAALGSRDISRAVEEYLGVSPGHTTSDRRFTYDVVYCLGNCALSPSVAIGGEVAGRVTPGEVVRRLQEAAHGE
jgi:formate dehydrogenase subunit gamma